MSFWLDLMFGSDVGLMSMLVIIATTVLICFYAGYFIYKVSKAGPNE
ncbi:DUF3149 domain-containing protein [Oceanisphaera sediminis]|uniref:DUF3149 domain-containing protein n=1 Tax=Oceanisphaera sediminis TaxID=981381 RepID=A0ABP7D831_9GAMM|nr:DUF3149 domain-containing protein [uncultured Oceanisphaera sp.]